MSWVCFFFSLSHTQLYTHTHAYRHIHLHTPTQTCLSSQSAFALLCSDTCSHLIIPSIYSGCACGSLSDYCMSCIECGLLLVVDLRVRTLSGLAWSCCEFMVFLCVLLLPPVSPVPRGPSRLKSLGPDRLQFCFVIFLPVLCLRMTDCLVLLLH